MSQKINWDSSEKNIKSLIIDVLKDYQSLGDRMHIVAIYGFIHAANTGSPVFLQMFFDGLRENDQNMLKAWLNTNSTYVVIKDGKEEKKQWLGFRSKPKDKKPAGFFVREKTQEFRKDKYVHQDLYDGESFLAKPDKKKSDVTLKMILELVKNLEKKVDKKSEQVEENTGNTVELPASLKAALSKLTDEAESAIKALPKEEKAA